MKKIWTSIRYYIFLLVGMLLLYYVFKDVDFNRMWQEIKGADFKWIGASFLCGIFALVSRSMRWQIILSPLGYNPSFIHCFYGVNIGYIANIGFPRMGEIIRCTILNRTDNIPVSKLIGTIILERVIDVIILLSLILTVIFAEFDHFGKFFIDFFSIKFAPLYNRIVSIGWVVYPVLLILMLFIFFVLRSLFRRFQHTAIVQKVGKFFLEIGDGFSTLFKMRKRGLFIFHTAFIWINYFAMTWLCFFAYSPTKALKAIDGLFMTVVGGLGMSAPVQGGFGTYHFLVEKALMLFNILPSIDPITGKEFRPGLVYATIVHSTQFVLIVIAGTASLIAFYFVKKGNNETQQL
jgi:uncharacterized protein (TIRG00374 family)